MTKVRGLLRRYALSIFLAVHANFGSVVSTNVVLPINPSWRTLLADNAGYLESIHAYFGYLAENEESRCPLHLPGDRQLPSEGPDVDSLGFLLSTLNNASEKLQSFANGAKYEEAEGITSHHFTQTWIRNQGFASIDDIMIVAQRLNAYFEHFLERGRMIERFLELSVEPTRLNSGNALLKFIYDVKLLPWMKSGIFQSTPAVELKTEAKDDFLAVVQDIRDILRAAMHIEVDQASSWAGSLNLAKSMNEELVPAGPWNARNLYSVIVEIGNFFDCWLDPVDKLMWNLNKLTPLPEVQLDLELESRPEANIITGAPEGWEWEHGTEDFLGLDNNAQFGPSTASDTSTMGPREDDEFRIGYVGFDNTWLDPPSNSA